MVDGHTKQNSSQIVVVNVNVTVELSGQGRALVVPSHSFSVTGPIRCKSHSFR